MCPTTACRDQNCLERVVVDHHKIELYCMYKNNVGLFHIVDKCRFPPPRYYRSICKILCDQVQPEESNTSQGSSETVAISLVLLENGSYLDAGN